MRGAPGMKTKTVLRVSGGVATLLGAMASMYVFGYYAGRYDALYRYGPGWSGYEPSIMIGAVLLLFGLFALLLGFLPVRWTDEEPGKS